MSELCGVRRYKNGAWAVIDDRVSREEAMYVTWSGPDENKPLPTADNTAAKMKTGVRLWAWPGPDTQALRELALGHVLLECMPDNEVHRLHGIVTDTPEGFHVRLYAVKAAPQQIPPSLEPKIVLTRMEAFMGVQGQWDGTGCFHRAGIWLPNPQDAAATLHVVEDIGRHNCLDRLMGYAATHGLSLQGQVLFVTARITASLYTKARGMGFSGIVSRSAVSLYSVETARRDAVRLIGFCRPREERFTVYA